MVVSEQVSEFTLRHWQNRAHRAETERTRAELDRDTALVSLGKSQQRAEDLETENSLLKDIAEDVLLPIVQSVRELAGALESEIDTMT